MPNIDFELRLQLSRVQPSLSLAQANDLIGGLAADCLAVRADDNACGAAPADFFTLTHVCGVALVAVCRLASVEFFAFAADESLLHEAEHLTISEVPEFLALARSRFELPEAGLVVSVLEALSWMEAHHQAPAA